MSPLEPATVTPVPIVSVLPEAVSTTAASPPMQSTWPAPVVERICVPEKSSADSAPMVMVPFKTRPPVIVVVKL